MEKLLKQLARNFPNLRFLSLLGNKACPNQLSSAEKDEEDYRRYRYFVISKLQSLRFLDSSKVTNIERRRAVQMGFLMKVVNPSQNIVSLFFINFNILKH